MAAPFIWKDIGQIRAAAQADVHGDSAAGFSASWRWFAGTIVLVPILLAAGVYWLHQQPSGPSNRGGEATIHVELIQTPGPAAEVRQASVRTDPPISDFQVVPSIAAPSEPSYRDDAPPTEPVMPSRSLSAPPQAPANAGQAQPTPAGAAFRFQKLLNAHIERYQRAPKVANRDGRRERVLLAFSMRRDGSVVHVGIKSSSGRAILDQEAVELIRRAQPLPRIPAEMPELLTVQFPVDF